MATQKQDGDHAVESLVSRGSLSDSDAHAASSSRGRSPHQGQPPPKPHLPFIIQKFGPGSPSARTGPPRYLQYSLSSSPLVSRNATMQEDGEAQAFASPDLLEPKEFPFGYAVTPSRSEFRSPLELGGNDHSDRKGKKRENSLWDAKHWFAESPKEENAVFDFGQNEHEYKADNNAGGTLSSEDSHRLSTSPQSAPRPEADQEKRKPAIQSKWSRLRSLLPHVASQATQQLPGPSVIAGNSINITDELLAGGLSTLMLRLWFERDENDHRRVPFLFHRLRIRISDSLHPLDGSKSVFRIECDYANGALRWVIYRQLRDFISLHTHYRFSNVYNRIPDALPEFPRTSLPYFKFLSREKGDQIAQSDFARLQRAALEEYLIRLIKAVMFHPSSNRLAGFLEVSALCVSLARSGGCQYKAGFLRIQASGNKNFGRKSAGRLERQKSRWCAVRENYLVVLEEIGELTVWEVFLLDFDFKIERPKRYYRQRLHFSHHNEEGKEGRTVNDAQRAGTMSRIMTKTLQVCLRRTASADDGHANMAERSLRGVGSPSSGDSDSSRGPSPIPTPMLDPSVNANPLVLHCEANENDPAPPGDDKKKKKKRTTDVSKHIFYIENSQIRLKLFARNERQMLQWITALERAAATSHFTGSNRFDSFAPIRMNVAAQWLVDGRDYFWNLSRAILLANESIYIHGWWLSPELQMRRPNKSRYRLDRLLERKAKEGIKIYIILYQEVSNRTTPIDSNYAKQTLASLHPNIMIQRSPSHFQTGTFYWAHHEKLCVIDQTIAFMGGLDLCFGRWDTPQHALVDDPEDEHETSIWQGKDYSNPRVADFHTLNKPEEDLHDRTKIPRMPWHDVGLQVVGQPARDLARHFVERWNYLLRIKNHSRVMPLLLPPSEFRPEELSRMGLTGTCEMQICRSAGPWSLGTLNRVEHSIQNAYLKAIQLSEHFVYIENQFFITSTVVSDVKIENRIGDALVHRIIRAHREGTPWKCCIVLPSLPGFAFPIDHGDASAMRIILECQNRTICRGPNSIFARLRKEGIDPDDYISVFALRNWSKLRGEVLTTEQIYVHAKICIVDDRLAIIGSANINERSMRGDRDSELATVIRDTDMMDCTMAGKPFKVGRFAHTLRVRLMREHLGIDVDALLEEDLRANEPAHPSQDQQPWDPDVEQTEGQEGGVTQVGKSKQKTPVGKILRVAADTAEQAAWATGNVGAKVATKVLHKAGIRPHEVNALSDDDQLDDERTTFTREGVKEPGFASSMVPTMEEMTINKGGLPQAQAADHPIKHTIESGDPDGSLKPSPQTGEGNDLNGASSPLTDSGENPEEARPLDGELYGAPANASAADTEPPHARSGVNDADQQEKEAPRARSVLRKHLNARLGNKIWTLPTPTPKVDPNGFDDPISEHFWQNTWIPCAVHNTEIYRKVFHAVPDDLITTWKQYKDFVMWHERLNKPCKDELAAEPNVVARVPSETGDEGAPIDPSTEAVVENSEGPLKSSNDRGSKSDNGGQIAGPGDGNTSELDAPSPEGGEVPKRKPLRLTGTEPFEKWERDEMEKLLGELRGHLVVYPTRFLEGEDIANNFLFNADRLLPLPIYN